MTCCARPVAHRDLWEPFLDLVQARGDLFPIKWVPSHIDIMGNERVDQLAEEGRVRHWAYSREWVREVQRQQSSEWQALGLQELDSEVSDSVATSEGQLSEGRRSCGCSTDCTCRSAPSDHVSEQGSSSSLESWETDPSSEPARPKRRIDRERESTCMAVPTVYCRHGAGWSPPS